MWDVIRREFRWNMFGFQYDRPGEFALWSWMKPGRICGYYVTYRCLTAALFLAILVANGSITTKSTYWFIYLTQLGFVLQTLHMMVSAAVPIQQLLYAQKDGSRMSTMSVLTQVSWFLYNATNMLSIVITVIYWTYVFVPEIDAMSFLIHGFNSIMAIVDIFLGKKPCRLLHFYQPLVLFVAYVAFSLIFWAFGGRNEAGLSYIYPILNWENLRLTVPFVFIGLIIGLPIIHAGLWTLHQLRDFCCNRTVKDHASNVETL